MKNGFALATLLLLVLGACPRAGLVGGGKALSGAQVLAMQRTRSVPDAMKMEGTVRIRWPSNGVRIRTGMQMAIAQPDSFRGDVLGFAGRPSVQLAMSSNQIEAYVRPTNAFVRGDDPSGLLARVSDGFLEREGLLDLLVGRLPAFDGWESEAFAEPETGQIRLELSKESGATATIWLIEDSYEPVRLVARLPGQTTVAYALGYEEFAPIGRYRIPRLVSIEIPGIDLRVDLEYSSVELAEDLPETEFHLSAPEGSYERSIEDVLPDSMKTFGTD